MITIKKQICLVIAMLTMLLTVGYTYDVNWLTPSTKISKYSTRLDNPNNYNPGYNLAGSEYMANYWAEAAAALYDYAGVQFYIKEISMFEIGDNLTQSEALEKYDNVAKEILDKDPYGLVLLNFDSYLYSESTGINLPYEKWYYGDKAREFFTPAAIGVWESLYDELPRVDYDLGQEHIFTLSALYAITGNTEVIPDFVSIDDATGEPESAQDKSTVSTFLFWMFLPGVVLIAIIVAVVVFITHRNAKAKELEAEALKAESDARILEADINKLDVPDDLLDKYK